MRHWISQTYSFDRGQAQTEKVQHKLNEHFTLCVLVLFLLAPRLLTTFLVSNFYIPPKWETLCQLYMCTTTCAFCLNLVTTQRLCVFLSCAPRSSTIGSTRFQPPAAAALSGRAVSSPSAVFMATKKQAQIQVCTWPNWLSWFIKKRRVHGQRRGNKSPASVQE